MKVILRARLLDKPEMITTCSLYSQALIHKLAQSQASRREVVFGTSLCPVPHAAIFSGSACRVLTLHFLLLTVKHLKLTSVLPKNRSRAQIPAIPLHNNRLHPYRSDHS